MMAAFMDILCGLFPLRINFAIFVYLTHKNQNYGHTNNTFEPED